MSPSTRTAAPPAAGTAVRVVMTKWGGRPHWEYAGTVLGTDAHGTWLGFPAGTSHVRPGAAFVSEVDSVTLVPAGGAWALAAFHAPGIWCRTYVDVCTPATWDARDDVPGGVSGGVSGDVPVLRAVDLDLDVLRGERGRSWVDDEDEFAEHRVSLGYPPEVVRAAERSAEAVLAAVASRTPPYDDLTAARWLARVGGASAG